MTHLNLIYATHRHAGVLGLLIRIELVCHWVTYVGADGVTDELWMNHYDEAGQSVNQWAMGGSEWPNECTSQIIGEKV